MPIDIIFLAKNRLEFTKASFETFIKNTNWNLVHHLYIYDDGSKDGTREYLFKRFIGMSKTTIIEGYKFGGPASVTKDFVFKKSEGKTEIFAKIDNDVIVPPNWLDTCLSVMEDHESIDLLGIEPWMSRTPHYVGGIQSKSPELDGPHFDTWAPCDSIGGIGLMRCRAFLNHQDLSQHSIYGGFTEWQLRHRDIVKGWIRPALNLFLLDRMPVDPWRTYSREYIAKGWQRAWSNYSLDNPFWNWWSPA